MILKVKSILYHNMLGKLKLFTCTVHGIKLLGCLHSLVKIKKNSFTILSIFSILGETDLDIF